MTNYEIISCLISGVAVIFAGIASYFAYKNLKEIRKQFFEQNRGNLVFYIVKRDNLFHSTIVKNFGNAPAKLIKLELNPELDWKKSKASSTALKEFVITNCRDVFLAPGQFIESLFDFRNYPDKEFNVNITYETSGITVNESYKVDISFKQHLASSHPDINNEVKGLKEINNSIRELSDRFL